MSRSYRKPASAITGTKSAKRDKRIAARGVRRKQNQWLRADRDFEAECVPHRFECAYNDVWSWPRDGRQRFYVLTGKHHARHQQVLQGIFTYPWQEHWLRKEYSQWPPLWYQKLMRK